MLPYLAGSGHNLYVKSAHVYLQDMLELEQTHPDLDAAFKSGLHVVEISVDPQGNQSCVLNIILLFCFEKQMNF